VDELLRERLHDSVREIGVPRPDTQRILQRGHRMWRARQGGVVAAVVAVVGVVGVSAYVASSADPPGETGVGFAAEGSSRTFYESVGPLASGDRLRGQRLGRPRTRHLRALLDQRRRSRTHRLRLPPGEPRW